MIYDLTQMNDEMDMLEIRLNILSPYVDKFVIGESTQTFSGNPKSLHYLANWERFDKWGDKITHVIIPEMMTDDVFQRTAFQKDYLRKALRYCEPDDLIIYGDVDEVASEEAVRDGKEGKLRQLCYSYYLNNRSSEDWQGTNIVRYRNLKNLNELRQEHDPLIENGGWHFTNMGGYDALIKKLESYDHQEANIPWVKDGLKARMDANIDFLGRTHDWQGNEFRMWKDESQLPQYLLDNKQTWQHLFT